MQLTNYKLKPKKVFGWAYGFSVVDYELHKQKLKRNKMNGNENIKKDKNK